MLSSKGFREVFNLSGGIKAWTSKKAIGSEDLGLDLFSGKESPEESILVAYNLEAGLQDFYLSMAERVKSHEAVALFKRLATVETKHQDALFTEFNHLAPTPVDRETFETELSIPQMEGGLTTDEYLALYEPDMEQPLEIISVAMAIEAQALDLYQRVAAHAERETTKIALTKIADQERAHIEQLGRLVDSYSSAHK